MALQLMTEKWSGEVSVVTLGVTKEEKGSRSHTLKVGGEKSLPGLFREGALAHEPKIAFEIWDIAPLDWPDELVRVIKMFLTIR